MGAPNLPYDSWDNERNCANHPNDQEEWQKIYCMVHKHNASIHLDTEQLLSQTLHDENIENFDVGKGRIRNKITGSFPCTLHYNGGAKSNMELRGLLKYLWI
jgi:hypothetical protein